MALLPTKNADFAVQNAKTEVLLFHVTLDHYRKPCFYSIFAELVSRKHDYISILYPKFLSKNYVFYLNKPNWSRVFWRLLKHFILMKIRKSSKSWAWFKLALHFYLSWDRKLYTKFVKLLNLTSVSTKFDHKFFLYVQIKVSS